MEHMGFGGEAEGKKPLGRPRHKGRILLMELQETGLGGMGWVDLKKGGGQVVRELVNAVTKFQVA